MKGGCCGPQGVEVIMGSCRRPDMGSRGGRKTSGEAVIRSGLARQGVFRMSGSESGAGRLRRDSPVDTCGDQTGVAT